MTIIKRSKNKEDSIITIFNPKLSVFMKIKVEADLKKRKNVKD